MKIQIQIKTANQRVTLAAVVLLTVIMAACGEATPVPSSGAALGPISGIIPTASNSASTVQAATPTASTSARVASNPSPALKVTTVAIASASSVATAAGASNEACGLVTKAEAEAILGEPLAEPVYKYGCEYRSAASKSSFPILAVTLSRNITRDQMQAGADNLARAANKKAVPVEGIGDYALDVDGLLYVLKGKVQLSIQPYDVNFDKQKRKNFALKALEKI